MATTDQDLINFLTSFGGARPAAPAPDSTISVDRVPRVGAPASSGMGQGFPGLGGAISPALMGALRPPVAAATVPATPANAAALAQADAKNVPAVPAVTAAVPAAKPAGAGGGAAKAPTAPKAPALIPGETGYYNEANQLVPYGVNLGASVPGAAAPNMAAGAMKGVPGGGANMIDPRAYFPSAVDAQMDYARQAANSILNMAGDGSQLGYSARLRALSAVFNNGLAQVGQGGANNFNSNIAGMVGSQLSADAQRAVAGTNAGMAAAERQADREARIDMFKNTAQNMGSTTTYGPGGLPMGTTTSTGFPDMRGGMVSTRPEPKLKPGSRVVDAYGNAGILQKDGTVTQEKK